MTLEEAVQHFNDVSAKLSSFLDSNRDMVEQYNSLVATCADAEKQVKSVAGGLPGWNTVQTIGNVTVKKTVQLTVDPILLRSVPGAEAVDGLFLPSVDSKVLEAAVKAGVLKKEHVDECRTIPYRTTVKVSLLEN